MDADEFPSNSQSQRERPLRAGKPVIEEKRVVERVTTGQVLRKKKSIGKRLKETFIGGDSRSVWSYVVEEVFIPMTKDMFMDAIQGGTERMFFGESARGGRGRSSSVGSRSYTNYSSYSRGSSGRSPEPSRSISKRSRSSHDFDEIILATRVEAEEVLGRLFSLVEKYEAATVADLYNLVDINPSYTDDKWGWEDLRGSGVSHTRGGYLLNLPKPEPLGS